MDRTEIVRRMQSLTKIHGVRKGIEALVNEIAAEPQAVREAWLLFGPGVVRRLQKIYGRPRDLALTVRSVLSALVPTGDGDGKELGALTARDLRRIAQFRSRMGATLVKQATVFQRIAKTIGDRTLRDCWGKIPTEDRRMLLDAFSLPDAEPQALLAAKVDAA